MNGNHTAAHINQWEWDTHAYNSLHVRLRLILEEVLRCDTSTVLELGCGVGVLRSELRSRAPHIRYFGCDISRSAVTLANDPHVTWTDLNTQPLPFPGMKFDCVIGSGILEYLYDVPRMFLDVRSVLNKNGRLIVSYFNMRHLYRRLQVVAGQPPYRNPGWVNDYTFGQCREMFCRTGFTVLDQVPVNIGLGPSPFIGRERWGPRGLRLVREIPFIEIVSHQLVFVCGVKGPSCLSSQ